MGGSGPGVLEAFQCAFSPWGPAAACSPLLAPFSRHPLKPPGLNIFLLPPVQALQWPFHQALFGEAQWLQVLGSLAQGWVLSHPSSPSSFLMTSLWLVPVFCPRSFCHSFVLTYWSSLSHSAGPFCLSFSLLCLILIDPWDPDWSPPEHLGGISGGTKAQKLAASRLRGLGSVKPWRWIWEGPR